MSEGVSEVTSTDWGFGRSRADLIREEIKKDIETPEQGGGRWHLP